MPYGIIKVDTVTFTDNGIDKNISLSVINSSKYNCIRTNTIRMRRETIEKYCTLF